MKSFFKLLLAFMLFGSMVAIPEISNGQVVSRKAKDSTSNSATKYITWNNLPNGSAGLTLSGLKVSGTVSGYAILQTALDTLPNVSTRVFEDYVNERGTRDTLFFTDIATIQKHDFQLPSPLFINAARFKIVTSGTQKLYLYGTHLQR